MDTLCAVLLVVVLCTEGVGASCTLPGLQTVNLKGKLGTQQLPDIRQVTGKLQSMTFTNRVCLDLSHNAITDLPLDIFNSSIYRVVSELDLSHNRLTNISSGVFVFMSNLKVLDLSVNDINVLESRAFQHLTSLETLKLGNNSLAELTSGLLGAKEQTTTLKYFDASHNIITRIGSETFHSGLSLMEKVDLSYNSLSTFEPWPYVLKGNSIIRELHFDLSHNLISNFGNSLGWISESENRMVVDLTYNQLRIFRIKHLAQYFKVQSNVTAYQIGNLGLRMDINPWLCDCGVFDGVKLLKESIYPDIPLARQFIRCESPSDLHGRYIGYFYDHPELLICNVTEKCPSGCLCQDRPHEGHVLVDCSHSRKFMSLPPEAPGGNLFVNMSGNKMDSLDWRDYQGNITKLDVSSNDIHTVGDDWLSGLPRLEHIDLRDNHLVTLPPRIQNFRLSSVLFSGNPLVCSCDTLWLNEWVSRSRNNVSADLLPECDYHGQQYRLVDVTWTSLVCYRDIAIGVSVALAVLLVIIVLATVVCWRKKYEFRVLLYRHMNLHPFDKDPCDYEEDATKLYDVYLSVDRENDGVRMWVKDKLLPKLEKKRQSRPSYSVYYPCRQDDFGDSIADQMVENINRSRRVLAIVNQTYLTNGWSIEEFDHSHRLMEEAKSGRVLVLRYGDLDLSKVTQEPLRTYLTAKKCLELSDKWLWKKLRYELPHRRRQGNTSASRDSINSGYTSSIGAELSDSDVWLGR